MNTEKIYNRILAGLSLLILLFVVLRFGWLALCVSLSLWYLGGTQGLLFTYIEINKKQNWR